MNNVKNLDHLPTNNLDLMSHIDDSIANNYYALSYNPEKSSNEQIVIKLSSKTERRGNEDNSLKSSKMSFHRVRSMSNRAASDNMARPSSVESRVEELLMNVNSGIQDGEARVWDASISFDSDENKGCSLTVAHAESPVSEKSRVLIYYRAVPQQQTRQNQASTV